MTHERPISPPLEVQRELEHRPAYFVPQNTIEKIEAILVPSPDERSYPLDARTAPFEQVIACAPQNRSSNAVELPQPTFTHEQQEAIRNILETEHGVTFHERSRTRMVPTIEAQNLAQSIESPEYTDGIVKYARMLEEFIGGQVITDPWGNDDEKRDTWGNMMKEKHGEIFEEVYRKHNQLRANVLTHVTLGIEMLGMYMQALPESETFSQVLHELIKKADDYSTKTNDDKMTIARDYVDAAIDALSIVFPHTVKKETQVT